MICIHHNDLDGRCAAAIVGKVRPDSIFIETNYNRPLPDLLSLQNQDVIIVDFSFKPDEMQRIVDHSASVTWIDHHATAKDYPYQHLSGLRDFRDKSRAGCELAWLYMFPNRTMPLAVQLIGDYDKWALNIPDSKIFYEGMKLLKNGPKESIWESLLSDEGFQPCQTIIQMGKTAILYRDNYCNGLCNSFGYETEIDGNRAYACNQFMFGSGGFGHRFHQYPLCIAYIHDGNRFTVSLYSETVDVGKIAKEHGGGGHKGAAGFVCETLPIRPMAPFAAGGKNAG